MFLVSPALILFTPFTYLLNNNVTLCQLCGFCFRQIDSKLLCSNFSLSTFLYDLEKHLNRGVGNIEVYFVSCHRCLKSLTVHTLAVQLHLIWFVILSGDYFVMGKLIYDRDVTKTGVIYQNSSTLVSIIHFQSYTLVYFYETKPGFWFSCVQNCFATKSIKQSVFLILQ